VGRLFLPRSFAIPNQIIEQQSASKVKHKTINIKIQQGIS